MRFARIPGVEREASLVCMGSAAFGSTTPEPVARDILDAYRERGGNFIDTARVYGDFAKYIHGLSEQCIGRWLRDRGVRNEMIIATKGGCTDLSTPTPRQGRLDRESLTRDLSLSLDALMVDKVDLYWIHRDDWTRPVGDILETLNVFVEQGLITAFGASNWSARRLWAADRYAKAHGLRSFAADELRWGLAKQLLHVDYECEEMNEALYCYHSVTGMPCMPYASQSRGIFNKLAQGGLDSIPQNSSARLYVGPENMLLYARLCALSERTGASVGVLQLAYLMAQPFPVFPVITASSADQIGDAMAAADYVMDPQDCEMLRQLSRDLFLSA
ncbi:MAG: aldo/keto reductase [Anaerolineae bacterium]